MSNQSPSETGSGRGAAAEGGNAPGGAGAGGEVARGRASSGMDIPRDDTPAEWRRWALPGLAVVAVAAVSLFVARLDPAAASVDREVLVFGSVERGSFVRGVRGPGTLVPGRVVHVSTLTGGRVDEIEAMSGAEVEKGSRLLKLSNPDVVMEALQAEQQLSTAQARLVELRRQLRDQVLSQEAAVAEARAAAAEARRRARTDSVLGERRWVSRHAARNSREDARAAAVKLDTERRRLELLRETLREEVAVQEERVQRLTSIRRERRRRVASLRIEAPAGGVLQGMSLEVGDWVQPGTTLAKVARPGRLKAELRVPEMQAREVRVGQRVIVDLRTDSVGGRVRRVDPNVEDGSVLVEVGLDGELPEGARPNLSVDGTIVIERLEDVLHVDRIAHAPSGGTVSLFRVAEDGTEAVRTQVRLGRSSVDRVEVIEGLDAGDRVIVNDMSRWDEHDRLEIE